MSALRATSLRMLRQDARPVRPALVLFLFLHGTFVPQSTCSCGPVGGRGKRSLASLGRSSRPPNIGGLALGGTGRRRLSSAGCLSATHMRHTVISFVARRCHFARAVVFHYLWPIYLCLARISADVEFATSVAQLQRLRLVTSSGTSRTGFRLAVCFPFFEPCNSL